MPISRQLWSIHSGRRWPSSGRSFRRGRAVIVNFRMNSLARRAGSPLGPHLREVFQAAPCEIASYLLDLWGMPDSVVAAVSLLEHPEKEKPAGFTATSALYIADQVGTRGTPPDPFPPEEWNAAYLCSLGCSEDLQFWTREGGSL